MAPERLQKILARAGVASRRKAEELIAAGLVTVNGQVAALGDKADIASDAIKVEGRRITATVPHRYLILNKPVGYVSTVVDPEQRPTVMDLVHPALRKALVPVGRLDFLSEGLILLTTDGEWAQRIAHPRYGCAKVYEAKVKGMPEEREVDRLRRGMWIDGKRTLPAEVRLLRTTGRGRETGNSWWEVVLREGRSRQIREMFFRVGHGVSKLRRVAIGPLRDPNLALGAWRELTEEEVEGLRRAGKTSAKLQGREPGRERGGARAERRASGGAGGGRQGRAAGEPSGHAGRPTPDAAGRRGRPGAHGKSGTSGKSGPGKPEPAGKAGTPGKSGMPERSGTPGKSGARGKSGAPKKFGSFSKTGTSGRPGKPGKPGTGASKAGRSPRGAGPRRPRGGERGGR